MPGLVPGFRAAGRDLSPPIPVWRCNSRLGGPRTRGARFLFLAWLLRKYGEPIREFIEKRLGAIAGAAAAALILLYALVKYAH